MEKETKVQDQSVIEPEDKKSEAKGGNLVKIDNHRNAHRINEVLDTVSWNQNALMIDLNGFVEGHEKSLKELRASEIERSKLKEKLIHINKQNQFLTKELEVSRVELKNFHKTHKTLLSQVKNAQTEYKRKIQNAVEKKRTSEEEYKKLFLSYKRKTQELDHLKKQTASVKGRFEELNTSYKDRIEKFKVQYGEKLNEQEGNFRERLTKVEDEKNQIIQHVDKLKVEISGKDKQMRSLNGSIQDLTKKGNELLRQKKMLLARNTEKEGRIEGLVEEVRNYKEQVEASYRDRLERDKQIEVLNVEVESVQKDREFHLKNYEEYKMKFDQLQERLSNEIAQVERLKNEERILNAKMEQHDQIVKDNHSYRLKEQQLSTEITELKEKIKEVTIQNVEYSGSITSLEEKYEDLKSREEVLSSELEESNTRFRSQIESLERVNKDLEQGEALARQENVNLKDRVAGLVKDLEEEKTNAKETSIRNLDLQNLNENLSVDLKGHRKNVESLSQRLDEEKLNVADLKQALTKKDYEIKELENRIESMIAEKQDFMDERRAWEKRAEEYVKQLEQERGSSDDLKQSLMKKVFEIKELESQIEEIKVLKDESTSERQVWEDRVDEISGDLNSAKEEINDREERIQQLVDDLDGYRNQIQELKDQKAELNIAINDLQNEVKHEQEKASRTQIELQENFAELTRQQAKEAEFFEIRQDLSDEKDSLEMRVAELEASLSMAESEAEDRQAQLEKLLDERNSLVTQKEDLEFKFENAIKDAEELTRDKEELDERLKEFQQRSQEEIERASVLEAENTRFGQENDSLKSANQEFERRIKSIQSMREKEKTASRTENEELSRKLSTVTGEKRLLSARFEEQKKRIGDFEKADQAQQAQLTQKDLDIQAVGREKEKLEIRILEMSKASEELNAQIVEKDGVLGQGVEENRDLMATITDLRAKIEDVKSQYQAVLKDKEYLEREKQENVNFADKVKAQEQECLGRDENLKKRENQLNLYSRWVDSQKESLQKHIVRFVQELKSSNAVSPLHSYLLMTEKEIKKVQALMSQSNVFGPQRAQFEQHHNQLLDQQDYIKKLIQKSERDVEARANQILGLLKTGEFVPVPPLPPENPAEGE